MKNLTFTGIDKSLEISLLECGLIVSNEKHSDGSGTQFVVYRVGYNVDGQMFGTGHISESDINSLLRGEDWLSKESVSGFLDFIGWPVNDLEKYIAETQFVNKLYDLIQYFGHESVIGVEYDPITEKQAIKRYLKS